MPALNKKVFVPVLAGILLCLILAAILLFTRPRERFATFEDYVHALYPTVRTGGILEYATPYEKYETLRTKAHTVAVVTPLDALTRENTYATSSGNRYSGGYSVRKVRVLKYFKNEKEYGKEFEMAEECGLAENGNLVMQENCWPMQKGDVYLVFLDDSRAGLKYPIPIRGCNGKFDLTHLELNCAEYGQVLLTALLKLELLTKKSLRRAGKDLLEAVDSASAVYWRQDKEHLAKEAEIKWKTYELYTPWTDRSYPLTIKCGTDEEGAIYQYLQTTLR